MACGAEEIRKTIEDHLGIQDGGASAHAQLTTLAALCCLDLSARTHVRLRATRCCRRRKRV